MTDKTKKWLIAGSIVLAVIVAFHVGKSSNGKGISSGEGESVAQTLIQEVIQKEEALVISPRALYSEYKENEVAADMKYNGKLLRITGKVDNIGKTFDMPYMTMSVAFLEDIHFSFNDEAVLATLKKGQTLTVEGRCSGFSINSVIIDYCEIIK